MTTEMRVLRPEEWNAWFGNLLLAFGGSDGVLEESRWRSVVEYERSLLVADGEDIVGTTGTFSFRMAVPGGAVVPTAGVTMVSVAPTHRRRGILTSMMRRQLDDVRATGEPLAVLTASEPPVYGRFGYAVATQQLSARIDTDRVRIAVPPDAQDVRLRRAGPVESLDACEALYARKVLQRPGMLERQPGWEQRQVLDPPSERKGASALQCVLAERDGRLVGYARYSIRPEWDDAGPKGSIALRDLEALEPGAYGALWRFLAEIDLTSTITVHSRPVDDPFQHMVTDPRRCALRLRDDLYLRPVDVGEALAARTYATPVDVVFEVTDDFCPWNTGRWRLSGDAKGAVCERTGDPAELTMSVRELGASYLGGVSLSSLAGAGRVRELRPGALGEASAAFGSDVAPWLPHGF